MSLGKQFDIVQQAGTGFMEGLGTPKDKHTGVAYGVSVGDTHTGLSGAYQAHYDMGMTGKGPRFPIGQENPQAPEPESVLPESLRGDIDPSDYAGSAIQAGYRKPLGAAEQLFQPSPTSGDGPYPNRSPRGVPIFPGGGDAPSADSYFPRPGAMGSGPKGPRRSY